MEPGSLTPFEGLKTFVVAPDLALVPEDFRAHFFMRGYEVYYVLDDHHLDLPTKIRVLLSLFPELILFVNIERGGAGAEWAAVVAKLKEEFGEKARLGVLYGSLADAPTRRALEKTYLYDIGISCGCIPVEYQKSKNLARLTSVLAANQANGRRRALRAVCETSATVNLVHFGLQHKGAVQDISISHFSCVFTDGEPKLAVNERCDRIQLRLGGLLCTSDALLCARRMVGGSALYVFVFVAEGAPDGPVPEFRLKINTFVHARFDALVGSTVAQAFGAAAAKKARPAPPPGRAAAPPKRA